MILSINIPDDKKDLIIEAYCNTQGYQSDIIDEATGALVPNVETRAQFVKRMIIGQIKGIVSMHERKQAEMSVKPTTINIT